MRNHKTKVKMNHLEESKRNKNAPVEIKVNTPVIPNEDTPEETDD